MVQIGYDIDVVLSTPRQLVLLVLYSLYEQNIPRLLLLSVLPPSWLHGLSVRVPSHGEGGERAAQAFIYLVDTLNLIPHQN